MKNIITFCFSVVLVTVFFLPLSMNSFVTAADCPINPTANNLAEPECKAAGMLGSAGTAAQYKTDATASLSSIVGTIIKTFLTLLGVIFLALTVYAGYLWLTARGEEKAVEDAKSVLKNAVIGLALSLAAYAITNYVVTKLVTATTT